MAICGDRHPKYVPCKECDVLWAEYNARIWAENRKYPPKPTIMASNGMEAAIEEIRDTGCRRNNVPKRKST